MTIKKIIMELNIKNISLFLSIITTALSAGLFYGWVVSVIPGTKKISDQAYLQAMQSINREILNPGFFSIFFGAALLLVIATFFQYKFSVDTTFYLLLSAMLIYIIGTIGVTMFGNVPLNNYVEALDLTAFTAVDFKEARDVYEAKWNQLNLVRTVAAVISFSLLVFSVMRN